MTGVNTRSSSSWSPRHFTPRPRCSRRAQRRRCMATAPSLTACMLMACIPRASARLPARACRRFRREVPLPTVMTWRCRCPWVLLPEGQRASCRVLRSCVRAAGIWLTARAGRCPHALSWRRGSLCMTGANAPLRICSRRSRCELLSALHVSSAESVVSTHYAVLGSAALPSPPRVSGGRVVVFGGGGVGCEL